jgi:hypothetical protein
LQALFVIGSAKVRRFFVFTSFSTTFFYLAVFALVSFLALLAVTGCKGRIFFLLNKA